MIRKNQNERKKKSNKKILVHRHFICTFVHLNNVQTKGFSLDVWLPLSAKQELRSDLTIIFKEKPLCNVVALLCKQSSSEVRLYLCPIFMKDATCCCCFVYTAKQARLNIKIKTKLNKNKIFFVFIPKFKNGFDSKFCLVKAGFLFVKLITNGCNLLFSGVHFLI